MLKELHLNNYEAEFILGNNDSEKYSSRAVIVNIWIRFNDRNDACSSDNLCDTICYSSLIKFLEEKLRGVNFNLIEYASKFVYDAIGEFVKNESVLKRVEIVKKKPLNKLQSATFLCSDW